MLVINSASESTSAIFTRRLIFTRCLCLFPRSMVWMFGASQEFYPLLMVRQSSAPPTATKPYYARCGTIVKVALASRFSSISVFRF